MDEQEFEFTAEKIQIGVFIIGKSEYEVPKTIGSSGNVEYSQYFGISEDLSEIKRYDFLFTVIDTTNAESVECAVKIANECKTVNPNCLCVCITDKHKIDLSALDNAFEQVLFVDDHNEVFAPVKMISDVFGETVIGIDYIDAKIMMEHSKQGFVSGGVLEEENRLSDFIRDINSKIDCQLKKFDGEYCGAFVNISVNPELFQKHGVLEFADKIHREIIGERNKNNLHEIRDRAVCTVNDNSKSPLELSIITYYKS